MRKLTILILLSLISVLTFAQRNCDYQANLLAPKNQTPIFDNETFDVKFNIYNNGPDTIKTGDTLYFATEFNDSIVTDYTNFLILRDIAPNKSSPEYLVKEKINFPNSEGQGRFCILTYMSNIKNGVNLIMDPDATNESCDDLNWKTNAIHQKFNGSAEGVFKVNAYPNPAKDVVNIEYTIGNANEVSISLYDVFGKAVSSPHIDFNSAGEHQVKLNISNLSSGLYFYEVKIGDIAARYRLSVL